MNILKKIYKTGELELVRESRRKKLKEHQLMDLFWECTLTCNANCKHCGSSAKDMKYENELETDEIKKVFKDIANKMEASKILINVTGGEPLVRKDLFDVMKYATNDLGFKWGMTTNGMLFDDEKIEQAKESNMETISISLDGLENTHDDFRGVSGSYVKIIDNIKKLKNANFIKYLQVTTVFHKKNINEIQKLYDIICDLDIDSWRLISMDPIGRANDNIELLLDKNETIQLLDFIKDKNNELKKQNSKKMMLTYGCPAFLGLEYEKEVRNHYFACLTGINIGSILYNGDIFVCPNVPRRKELMQGNVRNEDFVDIWNNKYQIFRDEKRTKCKKCEKCKFWSDCLGGAFHTWNFEKSEQNKCVYNMINDVN